MLAIRLVDEGKQRCEKKSRGRGEQQESTRYEVKLFLVDAGSRLVGGGGEEI